MLKTVPRYENVFLSCNNVEEFPCAPLNQINPTAIDFFGGNLKTLTPGSQTPTTNQICGLLLRTPHPPLQTNPQN